MVKPKPPRSLSASAAFLPPLTPASAKGPERLTRLAAGNKVLAATATITPRMAMAAASPASPDLRSSSSRSNRSAVLRFYRSPAAAATGLTVEPLNG